MEFAVYKVTGPNTSKCYYGYSTGKEVSTASETFLRGANRKTGDRGDMMMLEANGSPNTLEFEVVELVPTEEVALIERNNRRAFDMNSITGPTPFPGRLYKEVTTANPEIAERWSRAGKMRNAKTARDAFALGAWTFQEVKASGATIHDLDTLSPIEFGAKNNLPFSLNRLTSV